METIIASAITGVLALIGVIVTVRHNNQKLMQEMKAEFAKEMAVMQVRVDELTREVRKHNNFAERMPVVEQKIKGIEDKINYLHSGHPDH